MDWDCTVSLSRAGMCSVSVEANTKSEATQEAVDELDRQGKMSVICYPADMFDGVDMSV
jgi:hypothetical protein